ncbi:MAG: chemotaxis protein CheA [Thermodesulfovibrionales bacterium]|nr:chemotaxis protein CheA [Thermodesulfovibrionales bacterium]
MKASRREFILEAEELIEEAERLAIEIQEGLNKGLNPDTVNALFRQIHTLKGLSGLFQLKSISDMSHVFEYLLDDLRLGRIELSEELVEFILRNIDILKSLVSRVEEENLPDVSRYVRDIETFRAVHVTKQEEVKLEGLIDSSILSVLSQYEESRLKVNIKEGKGIYYTDVAFPLASFDRELKQISEKIKSSGELIATMPTQTDLPPDSIGFRLLFASPLSKEELLKYGIEPRTILNPEKKTPELKRKSETGQPSDMRPASDVASSTVKVDINKLDLILNTIGEISLPRGAIKRVADELKEASGISSLVFDLHKISSSLEKRIHELQDEVLAIRMVPLSQLFSKVNQLLRRYSREVNKPVSVEIYGEDTEIDKSISDNILEPLMHLVRNAIDHGIESSDERKVKAKSETGKITFRAYQKGNHVVIEVSDDGRGIDLEKVRKRAIERGILSRDKEVSKEELVELIFTPGFSTKETVTEISGRGVGMDVVRQKIASIGGFVEVDTFPDRGTTFRLTIPITLAIIKSIIVRVGREKFAFPLTSVSETLQIRESDIQSIERMEAYNLRGTVLPLIRISQALGIDHEVSEFHYVVVAGTGEKKVGLIVDELIGQQEIVIKPLGKYLENLKWYAGAAEVGRHELILVLDVDAFLQESALMKFTSKGA